MSSFLLRHWSRYLKVSLGVIVCAGLGGCAVSGRSAYIDSTSKMPFFNLELRGRKQQNSDPPFRSVRLDNRTGTQVEPLGLYSDKSASLPKIVSLDAARSSRMSLPVSEQNLAVESDCESGPAKLDFH